MIENTHNAYYVYCPLGVIYTFDQIGVDGIYKEDQEEEARNWLDNFHLHYCPSKNYRHQVLPGADPFEMNGI